MKTETYKTSRILYIIEAAVEYFISILVSGAYLAKLTSSIGLSDGVTGIMSAFVSLGCTFQIVALFLVGKQPVKRWVTALHTINQMFFAIVYFVPFVEVPSVVKTIVFVVLLLSGHAINNIVNSPKINWYMSLVDDDKRGVFTANKEIVSLIGGIIFTTGVGTIIDAFEASGNDEGALVFCGVGIFGLTIIHTITLLFSKEKEEIKKTPTLQFKGIGSLIKDKNLLKISLLSVLFYIANYSTMPFYGTYQIKELGFSMLLVSVLTSVGAVCRALCSRPMGKYADKRSFASMLNVCYTALLFAYAINAFTVPSNGKITYTIYLIFNAVAMSGINSGEINLVYDYVDKEKRIGAVALKNAIAGTVGFLTTMAVSVLVEKIQKDGNKFLGLNLYAQQVVSVIGAIVIAIAIVYLNLVVKKMKKSNESPLVIESDIDGELRDNAS